MTWFTLQEIEHPWLVYGLLTNDSSSAFVGKPKAGKSTAIRTLAVSIIKGRPFLGRKVFVPEGGGKVLYIHLDRKDPIEDVASELRALGITQEESERLLLKSSENMPEEKRIDWLVAEVTELKPTLVVIDLLFQFVSTDNVNDYSKNLKAINELQDRLRKVNFHGHLITAHHARKAMNPDEPFDDFLGTQAIRGSVSTSLSFRYDRRNKRFTVQSDQTKRAKELGEIEETVVERNSGTGEIYLGSTVESLRISHAKTKDSKDGEDVFHYIEQHPGCTQQDLSDNVAMKKVRLQQFLKELKKNEMIKLSGKGVARNPYRYTADTTVPMEVSQ